LIAVNLTR
jgi:hypothetical protein